MKLGSSLAATMLAAVLLATPAADAQPAQEAASSDPARLLAVPYLPQEGDLCGGAAAAMVLRYWGGSSLVSDFAPLLDSQKQGIPTRALVEKLRRRGWQALPFAGDAIDVRRQLEAGRPVVALVEDRPGRFHYVVLVGWAGDRVILHDPAIGPFRVVAAADFERSWAATARWAMLILPGDATATERTETTASRRDPDEVESADGADRHAPPAAEACSVLTTAGVDAARRGESTIAEGHLAAAMARCPAAAAPLRELAGLRFRQGRWSEAADLAGRAAAIAPEDPYGWRLLAAARFLDGERDDALSAWNRIGEPRLAIVEIEGLERTRHPIVANALGLRPGELLDHGRLLRARRRLEGLPFADFTRLRYEAPREARAKVVASVVERPLLPRGALEIGALAARGLLDREVRLQVSSPSGGGEVWTGWWRWRRGWSAAGLRLELPAPVRFGGVWSVDVVHSEESYVEVVEHRDRAGLTVADWLGPAWRWQLASGWDRWSGRGQHLYLGTALERRSSDDRAALRLGATGWTALGADGGFVEAAATAAWRSSPRPGPSSWQATAGLLAVGGDAPLDLWPGAGTGAVRAPLLRAHPLLDDGLVGGVAFGRTLAHATLERQRRLVRAGPVELTAVGFADLAEAWRRGQASGAPTPSSVQRGEGTRRDSLSPAALQVDVGGGLRLHLPGEAGALRVDVARGLRDGATALSVGWQLPWPGW